MEKNSNMILDNVLNKSYVEYFINTQEKKNSIF